MPTAPLLPLLAVILAAAPQPQAGASRPDAGAAPPEAQPLSAGAVEAIEQADVSGPGFFEAAEAQIAEGEAFMDRGEWQPARERIKGFLPVFMAKAKDSPLYPRVLADMGIIYVAMGNRTMGPRMLRIALEVSPGHPLAKQALEAFEAGKQMPKVGAPPKGAPARR